MKNILNGVKLMKIEIAEDLICSWLRHVKECQIVQSNWKASPKWESNDEESAIKLVEDVNLACYSKLGLTILKNMTFKQFFDQTEIDVVGISCGQNENTLHGVEVAFHESGLNYGDRKTTTTKVVTKLLKIAVCMISVFNVKKGELIFASPKINKSQLLDINEALNVLNSVFKESNLDFEARIIANGEFKTKILDQILIASGDVADTAELFIRSYKMFRMFSDNENTENNQTSKTVTSEVSLRIQDIDEMKVGKIASVFVREVLEKGKVPNDVIKSLMDAKYSKRVFNLNYPFLTEEIDESTKVRYYAKPLIIAGKKYYMCSQWVIGQKGKLLEWLKEYI